MNLKKIFFSAVTVSVLCALTGCDYIQEGKPESSLLKQEEEPRQPGGCKLKTAPVRPVVAARPAEYVCSEDLFY